MGINTNPNPQVNNQRPIYGPSYNAVQINMDTPTVNAPQQPVIYGYPQADGQIYYPPIPQQTPYPGQQPPAQAPAPTAETKPVPEPDKDVQPKFDIEKIVKNLGSDDVDVQAQQMAEIAGAGRANEADVVPLIEERLLNKLIDIVDRDTSGLEGPTPEQQELRQKIDANEDARIIAAQQGKDPSTVQLPYQLSEKEIEYANAITPRDLAEKNKEYALLTMAVLGKTFVDEVKSQTGQSVPFNKIPCIAQIVNEVKTNPSKDVRMAAIDSLRYLSQPEYKDELTTVYSIVLGQDGSPDEDIQVCKKASDALAEWDN